MLINQEGHDPVVVGFVIIMLLLIAAPLAVIAGVDSRVDEAARQRRFGV